MKEEEEEEEEEESLMAPMTATMEAIFIVGRSSCGDVAFLRDFVDC